MVDERDPRDPETLSVQLNEAFERLEKQHTDQNTAAPAPGAGEDAAGARRGGVFGVLAIFVALIATGIASWAAYTLWMMQDDALAISDRVSALETQVLEQGNATGLADRFTALAREVDTRLSEVDDIRARLNDVTARLADRDSVSQAEFDQFEERVAAAITSVRNEMGTSARDWLLAEVEYLIRLGAQRVEMQQDARGALALFESADDILRGAEGVAAFGLREALARDIAELQSVSPVDVDGIYVRLGAVKSQVDQLRQARHQYTPSQPSVTSSRADASAGEKFMAFLATVGARIASLVDYRRDEESIKPVLPPKEEYYLRQNLVFKIQLAQLALLREDQAIYDTSIREARQWLTRYFDPEHPVTQTMQSTLAELSGIDINQEMPDVSESLRAVRETLDRFHTESRRNLVQ